MGNSIARATRPLKDICHFQSSCRTESYSMNSKDQDRHSNASRGFRIEKTHRHSALDGILTLREACAFRFSSPKSTNMACDVEICTTGQEIAEILLASDDQHTIVAAIGNAPCTSGISV